MSWLSSLKWYEWVWYFGFPLSIPITYFLCSLGNGTERRRTREIDAWHRVSVATFCLSKARASPFILAHHWAAAAASAAGPHRRSSEASSRRSLLREAVRMRHVGWQARTCSRSQVWVG